jgi:hypothetical protein
MDCTCGRIRVGMVVTAARNWAPSCPEHGRKSQWWKDVGVPRQERSNVRLKELYALAREARDASE